jgi:hypothetical protein
LRGIIFGATSLCCAMCWHVPLWQEIVRSVHAVSAMDFTDLLALGD